ncbi:MAG: hypothetical protein F6J92_08005 [Symploca sp. SIO1A3]|nr:hypothetical protein [Symploca sp. SIO1A3]
MTHDTVLLDPYTRRAKAKKAKDKIKDKIAIILVPAIGASNIYQDENQDSGYAPDKAWLMGTKYVSKPAVKVAEYLKENALKWEPEDLDWESEEKKIDWEKAKIGWNQVYTGTYEKFLKECQNYEDFPFDHIVCAIGYNFFRSNLKSADRILERTEQILDKLKVDGFIYITHSMGALPVRAALKTIYDNDDPNYVNPYPLVHEKCLGVIHVAAPILGAPEAYIRFYRGVAKDSDIGEQYVLGRTGFEFAVKACFIPSMCEILPIDQYADHTIEQMPQNIVSANDRGLAGVCNSLHSLVENVLKEKEQEFNKSDNLNVEKCLDSLEENIESAKKFHKSLAKYLFPETRIIAIEGTPTVIKVNAQTKKATMSPEGDGTVPLKSQKYGLNIDDIAQIVPNKKKVNGWPQLTHGEPFTAIGKQEGVFDEIYEFLKDLYRTAVNNSPYHPYLNVKGWSDQQSLSLSSGLSALGLGEQPIFLNGQQAIFNKAVTTTPVTIEPKSTHR